MKHHGRAPIRSRRSALELFDGNVHIVPPFINLLIPHIPTKNSAFGFEDVLNWSYEGLWSASLLWNPDGGSTFKSYSAVRMRGNVHDWIRKLDPLPRSTRRMLQHMEQVTTSDQLEECKAAIAFSNPLSINLPANPEEDGEALEAIIPDGSGVRYIGEETERLQELHEALKTLSEQELKVITLFYWEDEGTFRISQRLGMTIGRINQILGKARERLKRRLPDLGI